MKLSKLMINYIIIKRDSLLKENNLLKKKEFHITEMTNFLSVNENDSFHTQN